MEKQEIIETIALVVGSYNMAFHRYTSDGRHMDVQDTRSFDGGIRAWCQPDYREDELLRERLAGLRIGELTLMLDRFGCRYLFLRFRAESGQDAEELLIAGPYLEAPNTEDQTRLLQQRLQWDAQAADSLLEYRSTIPVVLDEQAFILMLRRIGAPLAPGVAEGGALSFAQWRDGGQRPTGAPTREQEYEQSMAASMIEQRYRQENVWLDAMLSGDFEKVTTEQRKLTRFTLPGRFQSLRGAQNMAIILNTLLRKNLERVGIHPAFIDQISRGFTRRIDSCVTEQEVRQVQREMLSDYCGVVRRYAAKGVTPLIGGVMQQALLSLDGEVGLRALAEQAGVGESYLSARFKEETGMTFSHWLREKRVARAKELLKRPELSIAQVAEQVGIFDVSYFIRLFRRETGITPGEFRKERHNE